MIYSKSLTENKLLERAQGHQSLIFMGCRACANYSVTYDKNLPVYEKTIDPASDEVKYVPYAIVEEGNQLKTFFERQGFKTEFELIRPPCTSSNDIRVPENFGGGEQASPDFAERYAKYNAVISLCCASGTLGLRKKLGKTLKVIQGRETIGMGQIVFKSDDEQEYIYVDKQASTITPYGSQK
ncbi:MAG: hypothetical protein NWE83_14060 [Candidatus Bathyarchaeota archaeon]|nr:hypothetical protein [Candidatus Bathyarchaeota archaeon]